MGKPIRTDPEIVEALKEICEENRGILRPEDVVEAARKENSPLHTKFDWDDDAAAEKYRLWQARVLISEVYVHIENSNGKKVPTKVFVSLSTDRYKGARGYRTLENVMSHAETRNQLIRDALADMQGFELRYRTLRELARVFSAMRETRKAVKVK